MVPFKVKLLLCNLILKVLFMWFVIISTPIKSFRPSS